MNKLMITKHLFGALTLSAAFLFAAQLTLAANLSDKDKQFLASYEKIHSALVADDLSATKSAAKNLGDEGNDIANVNSLKDARAAFEKLSTRAAIITTDKPGYHRFHCPMLNKDWVQTSTRVANPYGGKAMEGCGEIRK